MSEFKSNIPRLKQAISRGEREGLDAAADALMARMKDTLSVAYPPASGAGQAPRMRSGRLRMSVAKSDVEDHSIKVGLSTDVAGVKRLGPAVYGKFLEEGTSRMRPRPFFKPMLQDGTAKNNMLGAFEKKMKEAIR
jgi:HK97 gp10 family phage protein